MISIWLTCLHIIAKPFLGVSLYHIIHGHVTSPEISKKVAIHRLHFQRFYWMETARIVHEASMIHAPNHDFFPPQWIILVLVIGGRDCCSPPRRQGLYLVYKRYIHCRIGWVIILIIYYLPPFTRTWKIHWPPYPAKKKDGANNISIWKSLVKLPAFFLVAWGARANQHFFLLGLGLATSSQKGRKFIQNSKVSLQKIGFKTTWGEISIMIPEPGDSELSFATFPKSINMVGLENGSRTWRQGDELNELGNQHFQVLLLWKRTNDNGQPPIWRCIYLLLKMEIFQCHVSFQGGNVKLWGLYHHSDMIMFFHLSPGQHSSTPQPSIHGNLRGAPPLNATPQEIAGLSRRSLRDTHEW